MWLQLLEGLGLDQAQTSSLEVRGSARPKYLAHDLLLSQHIGRELD